MLAQDPNYQQDRSTAVIRSFSGTHPWHPSVLADTDAEDAGNADFIIEAIEAGQCPRCEGPLPILPEFPAGSRVTQCRSIPICGRCGGDEVYERCATGFTSSAGCWPLDAVEIEARKAHYERDAQVGFISGDAIITEDGASKVVNPCNTGGWAQHGNVIDE